MATYEAIMQKCLVIQNPYTCSIKHCEYGPLSQPIVFISGTCTGVYVYVFPCAQSHDSTGQDKNRPDDAITLL